MGAAAADRARPARRRGARLRRAVRLYRRGRRRRRAGAARDPRPHLARPVCARRRSRHRRRDRDAGGHAIARAGGTDHADHRRRLACGDVEPDGGGAGGAAGLGQGARSGGDQMVFKRRPDVRQRAVGRGRQTASAFLPHCCCRPAGSRRRAWSRCAGACRATTAWICAPRCIGRCRSWPGRCPAIADRCWSPSNTSSRPRTATHSPRRLRPTPTFAACATARSTGITSSTPPIRAATSRCSWSRAGSSTCASTSASRALGPGHRGRSQEIPHRTGPAAGVAFHQRDLAGVMAAAALAGRRARSAARPHRAFCASGTSHRSRLARARQCDASRVNPLRGLAQDFRDVMARVVELPALRAHRPGHAVAYIDRDPHIDADPVRLSCRSRRAIDDGGRSPITALWAFLPRLGPRGSRRGLFRLPRHRGESWGEVAALCRTQKNAPARGRRANVVRRSASA